MTEKCKAVKSTREVVYPKKGKSDPDLGPVAVMVAMKRDLDILRRDLGVYGSSPVTGILASKVYKVTNHDQDISLVGPMLGAPYAAMILEKLVVLGVRKVVFLGWCGSICQDIRIGDFIVPDRAVIGEGTSQYYLNGVFSLPSEKMTGAIEAGCQSHSAFFHKGPVWSTDAPYRETEDKVLSLQGEGILGVDMEVSALFSVAALRGISIGVLLIVSDELGSLQWKPGFSSTRFNKACKKASEVIVTICQKMIQKRG